MRIDLTDKHFLVTGGGRGIGKAIVYQLLSSGASVSFTYNHGKETAELFLKNLLEQFPEKAALYQADIKDEDQSKALVDQIEKSSLGPLYGLINNAGITADAPFFSMTTDMWKDVMNTNLNGTYFLSKAVIKSFIRKKNSKIINISSVSGVRGAVGQANYGATKAAIISLTKTLALEFAKFNLQVNAIAPGFIDTEMVANMNEQDKKKIHQMIPMKRMGTPGEVADLVVFLCSENTNYMTGQTFIIDGGLTL
ncbi:beta-ketoacyl-ACP reductase [Chryseobacterium phosphatilyticum]|uniref:Beta-ketoacyl-ACP reductase n=1 Tax=Chryseobacterium phosphatilyticum TaxID=475075 RepID=A0A316XAN0_9FLAO|nr:3-oxoacyl-ACP reductase FabG [Chryseobacterium phosphatilyticum]PWN70229.1 beta-ketoacyl-ACP reductase [Chryseobacterium phosphatilyticum]